MPTKDPPAVTLLLERAAAGDSGAFDALAKVVMADLERLARRVLLRQAAGPVRSVTLDPSALVSETYVRMLRQRRLPRNRAHFFAIATRIMFRVLGDYNKAKQAQKRDAELVHLSLPGLERRAGQNRPSAEASWVGSELDALEAVDPRAGQIARLRVIWDLPLEEIAEVLGVSRSTVDRGWRMARSWLKARL